MALSLTPGAFRVPAALATAAVAVMPFVLSTPAQAATGSPSAGPGYCSSPSHPALAARLSGDIARAVRGRTSAPAFAVRDSATGVTCASNASKHFDSASIVKVTIMGAVLRRAQEENRSLSAAEEGDLRKMITQSDNAAAQNLWDSLGLTRVQEFLRLSGMTDTLPGANGAWGLTQVTAADELKQLDVFTGNSTVLTPASKKYGLALMNQVESDQRWGTPYGVPSGVTVQVKNGWLQRSTHGWRVHSLGIFTAPHRLYRMAILTQDDPTESYGIGTIQAVAQQVHADLGTATTG
jgi:beta-lactamase class A